MKGILPLLLPSWYPLHYFMLSSYGTLQIMEKKCWSHNLLEVFRVLAGASPTFHPGSLNTNSKDPCFNIPLASFLKRLWIHSSLDRQNVFMLDLCDLLPNIWGKLDLNVASMRLNELCIQNIAWYVRQCVPYVWAFWILWAFSGTFRVKFPIPIFERMDEIVLFDTESPLFTSQLTSQVPPIHFLDLWFCLWRIMGKGKVWFH